MLEGIWDSHLFLNLNNDFKQKGSVPPNETEFTELGYTEWNWKFGFLFFVANDVPCVLTFPKKVLGF